MNAEFAPLFKLGLSERLQLVEDLWDSIVEEGDSLPVSEESREELRARKERFQAHPASGLTWDQVKQHARSTHD
jgi:putative addiction module component (TIGR02574 family)